jgi:protocatechuate 3,4-dioxygenase, alpha subunit
VTLQATTWQTVGPFFSIGLCRLYRDNGAPLGVSGERVEISGRIFDGDGKPVPDAVVEIWQANSHGKYAHPEDVQDKPLGKEFAGFGRIATDIDGGFRFSTIKPGRVPGPDDPNGRPTLQAPHLAISILMRGLLRRLVTRMYFPDEASNAEDFVLGLVEEARRPTLIAKTAASPANSLQWDIVLQGANETVFFQL